MFCFHSDYTNAPYTGYYKLLNPAINLRDADLVKDVLIKDHFSFHVNEQNFNQKFDPLMAHNPFVATNDSWRKGRSVLTPTLTLFKVRSLHPLVVDSCDKLSMYLKTIPQNKDVEAKAVCFSLKLNISHIFSNFLFLIIYFFKIFFLIFQIHIFTKLKRFELNFILTTN